MNQPKTVREPLLLNNEVVKMRGLANRLMAQTSPSTNLTIERWGIP